MKFLKFVLKGTTEKFFKLIKMRLFVSKRFVNIFFTDGNIEKRVENLQLRAKIFDFFLNFSRITVLKATKKTNLELFLGVLFLQKFYGAVLIFAKFFFPSFSKLNVFKKSKFQASFLFPNKVSRCILNFYIFRSCSESDIICLISGLIRSSFEKFDFTPINHDSASTSLTTLNLCFEN